MHKKLFLIGAASHLGSDEEGCSYGVKQLCLEEDLSSWIERSGSIVSDFEILSIDDEENKKDLFSTVCFFNQKLAHAVCAALEKKEFPLILGGDRFISIGTWNGVMHFLKKKELGNLGLIWLDAHLNAQTCQTTSRKRLNQMPISALLGIGEKKLKEIYTNQMFLEPQNLCILGARSYEKEEKELLEHLGIKIYSNQEIFQKGMLKTIDEAIDHVLQNSSHLGLSINLDFFDPMEAPGVTFPEKHGFFKKDVFPALKKIAKNPLFTALEITEFNPFFDKQNKTKNLLIDMLEAILGEER